MLMMSGAVAWFFQRKRPDQVRGISYKQFVWLCVITIIGGALVAGMQFFVER
jgi:hypothetical protein